MRKTQVFAVRLTPNLIKQIHDYGWQHHQTLTSVVSAALQAYLGDHDE